MKTFIFALIAAACLALAPTAPAQVLNPPPPGVLFQQGPVSIGYYGQGIDGYYYLEVATPVGPLDVVLPNTYQYTPANPLEGMDLQGFVNKYSPVPITLP